MRELRRLGHRVRRPAREAVDGPLAALTAREREIAALVAAGRTNREVAEQLVLSARTIEAHLRNVYDEARRPLARRAHARGRARAESVVSAAVSEPDPDPLDQLSSKELHDLAVQRALRHADVRFFWQLLKILPAAETVAGEYDEAELDLMTMRGHLDDLTDSGRGETAEELRPFYLEYLQRHEVKP